MESKKSFVLGETVVCADYIRFADGTYHVRGQRLVVTLENQAYLNRFSDKYKREEKK